jgi:hypothetical protein
VLLTETVGVVVVLRAAFWSGDRCYHFLFFCPYLGGKKDRYIDFQEKRQFFRRKLPKILITTLTPADIQLVAVDVLGRLSCPVL